MSSPVTTKVRLAIDAMGGDHDPVAAIAGISHLCKQDKNLEILCFGDHDKISNEIQKYPELTSFIKIIHSDSVILGEDKPSVALRNSIGSSMRMAIEAVKNGEADAVISSGNTGALMAISKVILRTLPKITRPAIVATVPTMKSSPVALIDAGANAECNEQSFVDFAIMGNAFAKVMFNVEHPKIAILNIGIEDIKGTEFIKNAMNLIKSLSTNLNIQGYVEGDGIVAGEVDVVVTDGFTGNVALKTIEGTARFCQHYLEKAFKKTIFSKIGYLFASSSLKNVFRTIDKRSYNGAMLLGLNGVVVKSHGSADDVAFFCAVQRAVDLVRSDINSKINFELSQNGQAVEETTNE